jgi:hypothetical protein
MIGSLSSLTTESPSSTSRAGSKQNSLRSGNGFEELPTLSGVYGLAGGEIVVWAEGSRAIMLNVRQPFGDPVELGAAEALELGELLVCLAREGS